MSVFAPQCDCKLLLENKHAIRSAEMMGSRTVTDGRIRIDLFGRYLSHDVRSDIGGAMQEAVLGRAREANILKECDGNACK